MPVYYSYSHVHEKASDFEDVSQDDIVTQFKELSIPDRQDIHISGPIDTLLVNQAYYEGLPNSRIHVYFEDEHTIKSTLVYVPLSLLDDITEKNAFNIMYDQLNSVWEQPSQQEYAQALNLLRELNEPMIKETVLEEMQKEAVERSLIFFDLLEKIYQVSDIDFVNELLDLSIGFQIEKNIYKDKVMGGIFDSVDQASKDTIFKTILDTVSTLRALETAPCLTTATFLCNVVNTIKAMEIQPELLLNEAKGEIEKLGDTFACLFINENTKAVEIFSITLLLKIVRGLLAKNLGTTFEQYHAKRVQEVDYLILEKIAQIRPTQEELLVGPGSIKIDEKTVCTIELSENGLTGEPILLIECVTTV
jgi:hypothetical protein